MISMRLALVCAAISGLLACSTVNHQAVASVRARAAVDLSCTTGDFDITRRPGTTTYDVLACGKGASYACATDPNPTGGKAVSCELIHNP